MVECTLLSVLLIDDEPALLEVLKPFVERSGEMSVQTCTSATEALNILPEKSFDAIIVDYDMPEITGIDFLKILRSKGDTTPVIIFTGVGHERTAIDAINYGANFFLQKDEDPQKLFPELCEMVKTAVESKYIGKKLGTSRKILSDMINFYPDPGFAIDREGKVVAWNASMEQLTDTPAGEMMGKGDYLYTVPFFGTKRKMLVNLVFEPDEEIERQEYTDYQQGCKRPGCRGDQRAEKRMGATWTLWSKAMPVYDMQGNFIGSVGIVRDVTGTSGDAGERTPEAASRNRQNRQGCSVKFSANHRGKPPPITKRELHLYTKGKKIS